ncbi:hypothetical protein BGX26_005148 [Mortierella sp. AD094]|nr:hypothetical protein BGX26_005148 [Mortierella sp. AD094]
MPSTSNCSGVEPLASAYIQKTYYLICVHNIVSGSFYSPGYIFMIENPTLDAPSASTISIVNSSIIYGGTFVAIGDMPFALVTPSYSPFSYALELGGQNQGTWLGPIQVSIPKPNFSSSLSIGAIIGIVVGALVILGIGAFFVIRRRKAKKSVTPPSTAPNVTQGQDLQCFKQEAHNPANEYKGDKLEQIQFSSHPRPHFVTLGDGSRMETISNQPLQQHPRPHFATLGDGSRMETISDQPLEQQQQQQQQWQQWQQQQQQQQQ